MKSFRSFNLRFRAGIGLAALAAVASLGPVPSVFGADTAQPDSSASKAKAKPEKAEAKKLTGADLYAIHCNRCHPERYATEWTAGQWKTIITHMRVRANLPAAQARQILKFLQEDAGS